MSAVIEGNSSDSDIIITSDMRDRHDHGNTRNTSEETIVESTHYPEITIQEVKEIMIRPKVEIRHHIDTKNIRKDEIIAEDTSKKNCTDLMDHEKISSSNAQSTKYKVRNPTCSNHLTNGKMCWRKTAWKNSRNH